MIQCYTNICGENKVATAECAIMVVQKRQEIYVVHF